MNLLRKKGKFISLYYYIKKGPGSDNKTCCQVGYRLFFYLVVAKRTVFVWLNRFT